MPPIISNPNRSFGKAVTVLERLVVAAREAAHQETYRRLESTLPETLLPQLDHLLLVSPETNRTPLTWLRSGAVANTPEEILANLDKLRYLQGLGVNVIAPWRQIGTIQWRNAGNFLGKGQWLHKPGKRFE